HEGGLVVFVVGDVTDELLSLSFGSPQPFVPAVAVTRDHRVRRGEDGLRGPVVLFQHDRAGAREIPFELLDVTDRRTTERVDRLVRVADDTQLRRFDAGLAG